MWTPWDALGHSQADSPVIALLALAMSVLWVRRPFGLICPF